MLSPTYGVNECARALSSGVFTQRFSDAKKFLLRTTADTCDHLRRVARVMPPKYVHYALRILQSRIAGRRDVLNKAQPLAVGFTFYLRRRVRPGAPLPLALIIPG